MTLTGTLSFLSCILPISAAAISQEPDLENLGPNYMLDLAKRAATTTTSTKTTSSATSSASAVTCPGSNSTTYVTNGFSFLIQCGIDHSGGDLSSTTVSSFAQCISACATTTGCVDVSLSGVACYLKSSVRAPIYNGVYGALLISSSASSTSTSSSKATSSTTSSVATSTKTSTITSSSLTISTTRTTTSSSSLVTTSTSKTTITTSSTSNSVTTLTTKATSTSSSLVSTSTSTSKSSMSSLSTTATSSTSTTSSTSSTSSTSASATPVKNTGKRGLAYNNDTYTLPWSLSGQNSQVNWAYNWYSSGSSSVSGQQISNPALSYVPMLWSNSSDLTSVWAANAQQAINEGSDSLLAFNEPDGCYSGSACMTVNSSVVAYQQYMQPFAGKAKLGAPAITNVGLDWLDQFLGNCTKCTIDFVPIHWYSNAYAFSYLQSYVESVRNLTLQYYPEGIPLWLTEFGISDDGTASPESQIELFLQEAVAWLDAVPYMARYAFFFDGPGYLINANGTGLSEQGLIFNSYTAPCANWNNDAGTC